MKRPEIKLRDSRPNEKELDLLGLIIADGGWMGHDDERLAPYCSDDSTLTNPDVFNRCHDMGWLDSKHNHDTSNSTVGITRDGRIAYHAAGR